MIHLNTHKGGTVACGYSLKRTDKGLTTRRAHGEQTDALVQTLPQPGRSLHIILSSRRHNPSLASLQAIDQGQRRNGMRLLRIARRLSGIMRLHEAAIPRRIHVISPLNGSVRSAIDLPACFPGGPTRALMPTFFSSTERERERLPPREIYSNCILIRSVMCSCSDKKTTHIRVRGSSSSVQAVVRFVC